jgi:hypothetical protein
MSSSDALTTRLIAGPYSMTKSVDRYFEILDACVAAGGVLSESAAGMIDTVVTGGPLETNGAGVVGRWRVEARQVLRLRGGRCSADRKFQGSRFIGAAVAGTTRLSANLAQQQQQQALHFSRPGFQEARWPSHPMRR